MADHADGLIFISRYIRDRFRRRFIVRPGMRELVAHALRDPSDYVRADAAVAARRDGFIFVVDDYDHKDVVPTVELLAAAFPYESFVALGPPRTLRRGQDAAGGMLSDRDPPAACERARRRLSVVLRRLRLPALTDAGGGGTLVARGSALLEEIAARCMRGGASCRSPAATSWWRWLDGSSMAKTSQLCLSAALDEGRPLSWQDIGGRILAFLTEMAGDLSRSRSRSREHTVAQLMAAPMSLTDAGLKRLASIPVFR